MYAHIGGVPVEEMVLTIAPALIAIGGAAWPRRASRRGRSDSHGPPRGSR